MSNIHFISDLHLCTERPDLTALFIKYMKEIAIKSDKLFVLGDLFELWIGDDSLNPGDDSTDLEFYQIVVDAFNHYSTQVGELYFLHGNRDFLLSHEFENLTQGKLLNEPFYFNFRKENIALMHGDSLCIDDKEYQQFRAMVRNPTWQKEFLSLPKKKRIEIANSIRMQSKDAQKEKANEIMDVNVIAVNEFILNNNVDRLIHGHTHRQADHQLEINHQNKFRNVLADWNEQGFYLELNNSGITSHYFS